MGGTSHLAGMSPMKAEYTASSTDMSKVKSKFKTPEGRWALLSERTFGSLPFNHHRSTRMTLARLPAASGAESSGGAEEAGPWLIYNIGEFVYIAKADSTRNVRMRAPCMHAWCCGGERQPPGCTVLVRVFV